MEKLELPEECDNWLKNGKDGICSEDCKALKQYCWNGKVEWTEKCDNGKNNGVYKWEWSCTVACTYFDPSKPDCGNGKYDEWETCENCVIDLKNACMWVCGDWAINPWEECDNGERNGHDGKCTFECKRETDPTKYCGNKIVEIDRWEECDLWIRKLSRRCRSVFGMVWRLKNTRSRGL